MPEAKQTFESAMEAWQRYQDSPWGRLRYSLAEANLLRHLPALGAGPLRVLDLAGGDGGDAVRLAARGHHVTVVDYAPAMLDAARRRAAAAGVTELVTCVEADVTDLPAAVAGGGYDVVLCHNVLQYLSDAADALRAAAAPLRPGGLLSVVAFNRHSMPLGIAVRECDPAAALESLDRRRAETVTFGTTMTLYAAEEITAVLNASGFPRVAHYGIRSFCDYITDEERKHDPAFFADLERLEMAVTDRPPYPHTARLFQLVAARDGG